ncbi:hypothetical protein CLF_110368 [Clonorchis sinensis]|uniref:Uncharacterized protein n=1 Tax=Clonorchis sinensis TaxID=79923 RepID=G7YTH0_CLOSI|nr:hypothetical protein CLF_110368 [Clonorchis sinensis]
MSSSTTQLVVAFAPVADEFYAGNIVTLFGENLSSRLFCSVRELEHHIKQFERVSGSYYSLQTSKANSSGGKKFIKYQCHRKKFASCPNDGKRRRLFDRTKCEEYVCVCRLGNLFKLTRVNMNHDVVQWRNQMGDGYRRRNENENLTKGFSDV